MLHIKNINNAIAFSISLLVSNELLAVSVARNWREIQTRHTLNPPDIQMLGAMLEHDAAMIFTPNPSEQPTFSPTLSEQPSPTITSQAPSLPLTQAPSLPLTQAPTPAPSTPDPFPPFGAPSNPGKSYFNYDYSLGAMYGPGYSELARHNITHYQNIFQNNGWATNFVTPDNYYWGEFDGEGTGFGAWKGVLAPRIPSKNRCDQVGKQSPIDVRPNGAKCQEGHQTRTKPGDYGIKHEHIEKSIETNKLRLKYKRRPCSKYWEEECAEPDPPHADFPNGWGGFADLMHIDFKIPSEHTIQGERFDGEMQLFHIHPYRRRTPTVSVLMRASAGGHNYVLQQALDEFQIIYDEHRAKCAEPNRRDTRRYRNMVMRESESGQQEQSDTSSDITEGNSDVVNTNSTTERELRGNVWNPYHPMLVPSIYFYRYDGSITEPPCGEWVSWFISDKPMEIGLNQLHQMKTLLFTHISPTCERTSTHWRGSVVRPIQDTADRPVSLCSRYNFSPDN